MPIQAIDSDRLYRKIARQLSGLIEAGEFRPGERLPAERELAKQLAVSRPSVREALIALEIEGKVEVRVGSGVFVASPTLAVVRSAVAEGEGPFELIQARKVIEGETAAVAAREASEAELDAIRAAVDEMQRCHEGGESTDASDRAFHTTIARATQNHVLASVVQMLWDEGRGAIWKTMEKHFQTPALRESTLRDHRAVYEAIAAHDARAARRAMHHHLTRVATEFASGWDQFKKRQARAASKAAP